MRHDATMFLPAAVAAGLVLVFLHWAFWPHGRLPRFRVLHTRLRLRLKLHPGRGHATVIGLWLRWGRFAAFRTSRRSRRSLGFWARVLHPLVYSIFLGRAQYGHGLRLPVDIHGVILAPPREGKSAFLGAAIQNYPGPVVNTTTKADLFQNTSGVRAKAGPVHVFNPQAIGGVPSTFRWSPIDGCEDQATAVRRADAFAYACPTGGTEDSSFWTAKASAYLRALFHAAALVGGDMRLVVRWALGSAVEAEQILAQAGAAQWAVELAELRGEAQKTAATVRMVLSRALSAMVDPALAVSMLPAEGDGLDFAEFLADRGTLYMIADSEQDDSPLAPLFACLAGELHHVAELIGQNLPGGRLDPPLLMALDEIVSTCPVPLPKWCQDSGGKGIQIISVAHGQAQLRTRWKTDGARVILDTAGVLVLLPGITDPDTLEMASKLCGQVAVKEHGADCHARHDIMPPELIRQLPPGRALLIRSGLPPVVTRLPRVWKTWTYRWARWHGQLLAQLTPAPAPASLSALAPPPVITSRPDPEPGNVVQLDREAAEDEGDYPWNAA